ncbi:MAG: sodium:solute symporter [Clostridia bacterium]|nr:sodium:solute symporter [Clostridia bacterium]MBQ8584058.1 sodium:solute symporter [Clostridia bacterium]
MNTTQILTTILVVLFFGLMVGVGFLCRKRASDVDGFVLGGRSVGPWLTAFAFGTSYFSAVIFVGYAGQFGYNFGLASTWIGLGNAFIGSLLAWNVLGRRTRLMTQHIDSRTMPDFFEKRYGSRALKIAASVIVFIFLIPYTASLYNGLSSLFAVSFNIPYWICIVVMAALTCVYVIFGGYMATAVNDFIQGIIMLVGIVAVIAGALSVNGGFMGSVEALATSPVGGWEYTALFGPDPISLLMVVMLTSLGTWGLPQMVGKFYSIKNESMIKTGTLISTVFAIIVAGGCYFLGGFGRLFVTPESVADAGFDSIIPTMISGLSPIIVSVVIVLVLSASMSTLSSLVLTSSSTLTLDIVMPLTKNPSEKKKLLVLRLFILFFIVLSAVIAILKDTVWSDVVFIAQMMGVSWGALAGAFLAPFLYGLYWKGASRPAVWASFGFGVGIMLIQLLLSLKLFTVPGAVLGFVFKNSLHSGVFAMLGGLVIVPIVSLFTRSHRPEDTDKIFSCYDAKVVVPAKSALDSDTIK